MKKITIQNSFFFLTIFSFSLFSQDKDFQSWNNIEFTYDIANNVRLSMDNGFRLTEGASVVSKYFFDFSVKRKHNKMVSYSIGYRHLSFREIDPLGIEEKNRFYADGYFKKNISNRFKYGLRTRFQTQIDNNSAVSQEIINKLRQKFKLTYDIKKSDVDVIFSIESFYIIGDVFEKLRYQIGCVKHITQKTNLNISYMIQQELDNSNLFFIIRAKLSHEF
jgi:hypothetical protein